MKKNALEMPIDLEDLGQRIYHLRVMRGWTQERLASQLGKTPAAIGHIERGMRAPSLETLVALSGILDVSIDYLLEKSLPRRENSDRIVLSPEQTRALRAMRQAFWPYELEDLPELNEPEEPEKA